MVEWLSRLKLDLEAVEEDASDEVLQFEIQISLIYCYDLHKHGVIQDSAGPLRDQPGQ